MKRRLWLWFAVLATGLVLLTISAVTLGFVAAYGGAS